MLSVRNSTKSGYSQDTALRFLNQDLEMINVTLQVEEVHRFDKATRQYLPEIDHHNIYVCQHVGDYVQNPIKVKITGNVPKNLTFGQTIKLKKLEACQVKVNGYNQTFFKADSVEIIKGDK